VIGGEMAVKKTKVSGLNRNQWVVLVLIGVAATAFNYLMQVGYNLAPNIGYINALNAASIGVIALGSALLFGDHLNLRKLIGIVGMIAGVVLVVT
jgi:drug/metabolite transporter (DMT)-like permease